MLPPRPDALRELQAPPHRSAGPGGGAEAGQLCAADAAGRSVLVLRHAGGSHRRNLTMYTEGLRPPRGSSF